MTLIHQFFKLFTRRSSAVPALSPDVQLPGDSQQEITALRVNVPFSDALAAGQVPPLPDWLADEEMLRDEGTLFGLSDARPDTRIAQIRAFFASASAPLTGLTEQLTEQISALNRRLEQREDQISSLRNQVADLQATQPVNTTIVRHLVSLLLSLGLSLGTFYLIDETLRPHFSNRWIAVSVFLAGMFNLYSGTSFFYEANTRLSGRRLVEEVGLPLAASLFILVQAVQTQPAVQAVGLFLFVLFVFLLSGKLALSTLTVVQREFSNIRQNRLLVASQKDNIPRWESQLAQLERDVEAIQTQQWSVGTALNQAETKLTQLNTQRDKLVNVFLSEFELARSLRDRLTNQQRTLIMND